MKKCGVSRIIFTDIDRDGTKTGVDFVRLKKIDDSQPISFSLNGYFDNLNRLFLFLRKFKKTRKTRKKEISKQEIIKIKQRR